MTTTLTSAEIEPIATKLSAANRAFLNLYPGESNRRQPVHVVYGGAHLFKADSTQKLGTVALRTLREYAPDAATLAEVLRVKWSADFAQTIYGRIVEKLQREAIEDFRLDFEDGYGNRADSEEDGHAASSAAEVARGFVEGTLPASVGIRIKPLNEDLRARSMRTFDIFITSLINHTG